MPAYLGNLGALFAVECEAATDEAESRYTFEVSLEGKRRGQYRASRPRTWEVDMGLSSSEETANLRALDAGEYGPGPFAWISEEAQATNALIPEVSTCGPAAAAAASVSVAGPLALAGGGVSGRSLLNSNTSVAMNFGSVKTPVLPGQPVTGSAWVVGSGSKVALLWYDAAGALIPGSPTSAASGIGGSSTRLSVTATPPAGAASCILSATSASNAARPALTWSAAPAAWAPGSGCPKAVVSKLANTPVVLGTTTSHTQVQFTITEVG